MRLLLCALIAWLVVGPTPAFAERRGTVPIVFLERQVNNDVHEASSDDVLFKQEVRAAESVRLLGPVNASTTRLLQGRRAWTFEQGQLLYRAHVTGRTESVYCATVVIRGRGERGCLGGSEPGVFTHLWAGAAPLDPTPPIDAREFRSLAELSEPARYEIVPDSMEGVPATIAFQYLWGDGPRIGIALETEDGDLGHIGFVYVTFSRNGPFPLIVNVAGARFEILDVIDHRIRFRALNAAPAGSVHVIEHAIVVPLTIYIP